MSSDSRKSLIARLLAGVETPDDLTADEKIQHREDLLEFLQADYAAASFKCSDPYGPDCHDDRCSRHYGETDDDDDDDDDDGCRRCGSEVVAERCWDETCPFSDCSQDDPEGWTGHPLEPTTEDPDA